MPEEKNQQGLSLTVEKHTSQNVMFSNNKTIVYKTKINVFVSASAADWFGIGLVCIISPSRPTHYVIEQPHWGLFCSVL